MIKNLTLTEEELLDKFAGDSLILAHKFLDDGYCGNMEVGSENIAKICYEIADAMIEERRRRRDRK